jgi:AcrR family transcriptional regulator
MERPKVSARRADAMINREHILEAAQSVFAEYGLDLEIGEVATRANLGVGTLYRHFTNREDLLRAIVLRTIEEALMQLRSALASASDDPCTSLQTLVATGLRVKQRYRLLFELMRDPRLGKLFDPSQGETIRVQFLAIFSELIDRGIKARIFRDDLDQEVVATVIIGSFTSAFDYLEAAYSLDELTQKLSHILLTMLIRQREK